MEALGKCLQSKHKDDENTLNINRKFDFNFFIFLIFIKSDTYQSNKSKWMNFVHKYTLVIFI